MPLVYLVAVLLTPPPPKYTMDTRLWFLKNTYHKQYTKFTRSRTDAFSWAQWESVPSGGRQVDKRFTFSLMLSISTLVSNPTLAL